jgi:2-oxoglutarate ferredoxin oxidoreductase subunit beta
LYWLEKRVRDNTYVVGKDYDPTNRVKAFEKSLEREPWPLGLIYKSDSRKSYNKNISMFENDSTPLYKRKRDISVIRKIMESKK